MLFRPYQNSEAYRTSYIKEEEAVLLARNNDPHALEYLIYKYKNFIRHKSKSYFIIGAEREDLIQEGLIGLYKAIMAYDMERAISFKNFACLCITRQIITAIKSATRQKHIPLNSYVSLNKPIYDEENDRTVEDLINMDGSLDPMDIYISGEQLDDIENRINKSLSKLELTILIPYINGKSYKEIAHETKKTEKCIDNALQRIRRKLGDYIGEE